MIKIRNIIIIVCIIITVSGVFLFGVNEQSNNKEIAPSYNTSMKIELKENSVKNVTLPKESKNITLIINANDSNSTAEMTMKNDSVVFYVGPKEGPLYDKAHSNETIGLLQKLLNES